MSELQTITPERAAELMRDGAVMIDIREANEHARERIPGARHHALSRLDAEHPAQPGDEVLVFHCRSGARTQANAPRLSSAGGSCETYILEGGIEAWKKAGLPTTAAARKQMAIGWQIQIVAGALVLAGLLLGALVRPDYYLVAAFGGWLAFAGGNGCCGVARLFALMPWNRRAA
jgi:rhodanese-related sulfurtransferase